jgi:hypothetical protein
MKPWSGRIWAQESDDNPTTRGTLLLTLAGSQTVRVNVRSIMEMKTSLKRTGIVFLILCPSLFLLHAIAWADIIFWKTGTIAMVLGMPSDVLLWPLSLMPVTPGNPIDGPHFWLPMICVLLLAWSWLIQFLIQKMKKAATRLKMKAIWTTIAILLPCIACMTTNVTPNVTQNGTFITQVRQAIAPRDAVALRRLCASSVPSPFHQPFFLSYLDRLPTNALPDGACFVTLETRQANDNDTWTPKPIMTLGIDVQTRTSGFGIRHPVGLQGGQLKLCDSVESTEGTPSTSHTVPPKPGGSGGQ